MSSHLFAFWLLHNCFLCLMLGFCFSRKVYFKAWRACAPSRWNGSWKDFAGKCFPVSDPSVYLFTSLRILLSFYWRRYLLSLVNRSFWHCYAYIIKFLLTSMALCKTSKKLILENLDMIHFACIFFFYIYLIHMLIVCAGNCCDDMRSWILASFDYCTIFVTFTLGNSKLMIFEFHLDVVNVTWEDSLCCFLADDSPMAAYTSLRHSCMLFSACITPLARIYPFYIIFSLI